MKTILKNNKKTEAFQQQKLEKSIVAACRSMQMSQADAKIVADMVIKDVKSVLEAEIVGTDHLKRVVRLSLQRHNPDAAYLYKNYCVMY